MRASDGFVPGVLAITLLAGCGPTEEISKDDLPRSVRFETMLQIALPFEDWDPKKVLESWGVAPASETGQELLALAQQVDAEYPPTDLPRRPEEQEPWRHARIRVMGEGAARLLTGMEERGEDPEQLLQSTLDHSSWGMSIGRSSTWLEHFTDSDGETLQQSVERQHAVFVEGLQAVNPDVVHYFEPVDTARAAPVVR